MKSLPRFQPQPYLTVEALVTLVFTNHATETNHLLSLVERNDNSYRVFFHPAYFTLREGQLSASKSQWGTLKKKLKRHDSRIFVFKDFGYLDESCYLDFGFFQE